MTPDIDNFTESRIVKQVETVGFNLTEQHHAPYSVGSKHTHDIAMLGISYRGSFTEIIGSRSEECMQYSLSFLPAGECHEYKFHGSGVQCLAVEVKPPRLAEIQQWTKNLDQPIFLGNGLSLPIIRLYEAFCARDQTLLLTLEGIIFEVFGETARSRSRINSGGEPKWLRRIKEYVHENFRSGISLSRVATLFEVHPTYLARRFRQVYHCSIGEYVKKLRLEYAAQEISKTYKSLSEIAFTAGFSDQSHLTREFKLRFKMTPAEFRRLKR